MTQVYFMKLTNAGAAAIAAEQAGGAAVSLTEMAVGDGGGAVVGQPTGAETVLIGEQYRDGLASLAVNATDPTIVEARFIVPATTGGFSVREVGVFIGDGTLFAYGNFPETYKPTVAEGSTRQMIVVAAMKVGTADSVVLTIDANVVVATQKFVVQSQALQDAALVNYIYFMGQN
jgi:phage-related tail fiber protein